MSSPDQSTTDMKVEAQSRFRLGRIVATRTVIETLSPQVIMEFVHRHASGDWGEVNAQDAQENEFSLKNGFRIFSSYRTTDGTKVWVITDADRSSTTVMFPEDY